MLALWSSAEGDSGPGPQEDRPRPSVELEAGERALKGEDAEAGLPEASRYPIPPEADVASYPTPPSSGFPSQGMGTASGCGVAHMPRDGPREALRRAAGCGRRGRPRRMMLTVPSFSNALSAQPGKNARLVSLPFHLWEN